MRNIRHGLFLLATASCVGGSFTFYTSQSAFQAAIVPLQQQTITFDNLALGIYSTLSVSGATFTGDNLFDGVRVFDQATWTLPFLGSTTGNSLASGAVISVSLPPGVRAVGFLVGASFVTVTQSTSQQSITFDTASTTVLATPLSPFPFIGAVSDGPISTVTIRGGDILTIDNFTMASVPEPSSALLLAILVLALTLRRHFQRQS